MRHMVGLGLFLTVLAGPLMAMVPEFAAPARVSETTALGSDSYQMPVGPFSAGKIAVQTVEGAVTATAYQIDAKGLTTLEIVAPLRDQVTAAGYQILFECAADDCGGFDFRFGTRVIAEPAMHVDLADYRFLSATRSGPAGTEAISLLVSRSALLGFVQLIEVGAARAIAVPAVRAPVPEAIAALPLEDDAVGAALSTKGSLVLEDVVFASGASVLGAEPIASLTALAAWLKADPSRAVVVVGHTDASGGLAINVALGAQRADAIRGRLVGGLGVPSAQVTAEGAGYLAPRASNLTEDGRRLNRRVEVVLVPAGN